MPEKLKPCKQVKESGGMVVIEDPLLKATSPMLIIISQFTGLVKLARDLVMSERAGTT